MRISSGIMALAVMASGLVAGVGASDALRTPAAATGSPYCGITWGSLAESSGALSGSPLVTTRTGRHTCFDRVVFEFDGPADGYTVEYGQAYTGGEGLALSPYTAGGATLSVQLRAPAYGMDGKPTYPHRLGDHVATVVRYRTLRDVVFGGSFEGYTTFAVGVRARLPFRAFVLSGPGTHSRIVLDVAHQWQE
jgi:hypothetical protein